MARDAEDTDDIEIDDTDDSLGSARDAAGDDFDEEFDGIGGLDLEDDDEGGEGRDGDAIATGGESLDEEDEESETIPVEGVDRGDGRDGKGKFAKTDAKVDGKVDAKSDAKLDAKAGDAPAAGAAAAKPADAAAAAPEPKWEPLQITADKALVPIKEAQITRANGYTIISVKDADFPRMQERLGRAHLFERHRQAIEERTRTLAQGVKDLEAERAAPQAKSDEEIAAAMIVETIGDRLAEVLEPHELENLKLRIQIAQKDGKDASAKARKEYFDGLAAKEREANAPLEEQETQLKGVADTLFGVLARHKEALGTFDDADLRAVYDELTQMARAVYWKEKDGWYHNTQVVFDALKRRKDAVAARTAAGTTGAPPTNGNTAAGGPTAAAAGDAKGGKDKAAAAERFNRNVDSGARPRTTSVKDARDTSRPRAERNTRELAGAGAGRGGKKTAEQQAEDDVRKSSRKWLRSDTLDIEDDDDE